jgi:uncharacterized protein with HEPN domain
MSRRSDEIRLSDMLAAARDAVSFVVGKAEGDLYHDKQLALALLKCVEIVGEAAVHISDETRRKHPAVAWTDMIGMRNRLVHDYFDVDLALLWTTVTEDLPSLIPALERMVAEGS